jgi:nitronate monooxygenase
VISGTALDRLIACRLQDGDQGGHIRRVLAHFPVPALAQRVLDTYFVHGGITTPGAYRPVPMFSTAENDDLLALTVVANYAEVALAREGHDGVVGINLLEKIQLPTLPSLYGAMLAGVDYVLMGAGIPRETPGHLDLLAQHQPASLRLRVDEGEDALITFDPRRLMGVDLPPLKRPDFLAIISSDVLAVSLKRNATGRIDGFVVEGATAGGHNAPPRGGMATLSPTGEPVYGPRDQPDLVRLQTLGLPFWLAGSCNGPDQLRAAQTAGAVGIQVGTAFAFCADSGMAPALRSRALAAIIAEQTAVFTDPRASPTGFPFKVLGLSGTVSTPEDYAARPRICNLGYLRSAYRKADGSLGWRCATEPEAAFLAKGGKAEELVGRKCLCNGLMATVGHPNRTAGGDRLEPPILTAGDDLAVVARLSRGSTHAYTANDVISYLTGAAIAAT